MPFFSLPIFKRVRLVVSPTSLRLSTGGKHGWGSVGRTGVRFGTRGGTVNVGGRIPFRDSSVGRLANEGGEMVPGFAFPANRTVELRRESPMDYCSRPGCAQTTAYRSSLCLNHLTED